MNNYITLDGWKYHTHGKSWQLEPNTPSTVRFLLNGNLDATYGNASPRIWKGEIKAPTSAATGWGTISTLRTTLAKRQILNFTDHYDVTYQVAAQGPFSERSLSVKWDGPSNKIFVSVTLIGKV